MTSVIGDDLKEQTSLKMESKLISVELKGDNVFGSCQISY